MTFYTKQHKYYCGIDLHTKVMYLCIMDQTGEILGIPKDFAIITGASCKSYWHLSKSYATNAAMSNKWLEEQGLVNIKYLWCKAQGYI